MNFRTIFFTKKRLLKYIKKSGVSFGDNFECEKSVSFGSEPYLITIGNNVKLSHGVTFITHDGGVYVLRNICNNPRLDCFGKITIGNNVFIGNKATIMPGVNIGNNVVIGLGSIVTKDIPDNSVAAGCPAKIIESIDQYKEKKMQKVVETKQLSRKEKREYLRRYI